MVALSRSSAAAPAAADAARLEHVGPIESEHLLHVLARPMSNGDPAGADALDQLDT